MKLFSHWLSCIPKTLALEFMCKILNQIFYFRQISEYFFLWSLKLCTWWTSFHVPLDIETVWHLLFLSCLAAKINLIWIKRWLKRKRELWKELNINLTWYNISRASDLNGVSRLYIIVEIHHSGRKPWICTCVSDEICPAFLGKYCVM